MKKENIIFNNIKPKNDLSNQIFNRLFIVKPVGQNKFRQIIYLCKCDCGGFVYVVGSSIKNGHTKSCGCLQRDTLIKRITKHGMWSTSVHHSWNNMKDRCYNKNNIHYQYYGGRGISVCDRWRNSFKVFYEDMGEKPSKDYSIDRINNDGNYELNNCKWSTKEEQRRNKSNSIYILYNNQNRYLKDWCKILGFKYRTLYNRLYKLKWSVKKAFETPIIMKYSNSK